MADQWSQMQALFQERDKDNTNDLDLSELALVLKDFAKAEGTARSKKAVERELNAVMNEYDTDGTGTLDFHEFLIMVCKESEHFKLDWSEEVKQTVLQRVNDEQVAKRNAAVEQSKSSEADETKAQEKELTGANNEAAAESGTNTTQEIEDLLQQTFKLLDRDEDSRLNAKDVKPFIVFNFQAAGEPVSMRQAHAFVKAFDVESKGSLSVDDYRRLLTGGNLEGDSVRQRQCLGDLHDFLRNFDFDAANNEEEIAAPLTEDVPPPTPEVSALIDTCFALLDKDKDGRLDWREIRPFVAFNFQGRAVSDDQAKVFVEAFDSEKKESLSMGDFTKLLVGGNLKGQPQRQLLCLKELREFLPEYKPT